MVWLLDQLDTWVDDTPAHETRVRYGNPGFRDFFERVDAGGEGLLAAVLPPEQRGAVSELHEYLRDSMGNKTRIDYGTGHETTFAALLYCLAKLGLVSGQDASGLVLVVF